jgi:hypothetical protein
MTPHTSVHTYLCAHVVVLLALWAMGESRWDGAAGCRIMRAATPHVWLAPEDPRRSPCRSPGRVVGSHVLMNASAHARQDDAILRVTSTAICGSDLHIYGGSLPRSAMQKGAFSRR